MNQYIGPGLGVTAIIISGAGTFWLNNKINTEVSLVNEKLKEHEKYIDVVPKLVTNVTNNHSHIKVLNDKFLNLNKKIKNQNKTIDALQAQSLYHRSMISVLHQILTPLLAKSDEFDGKADLVKKLSKVGFFIVKNQKNQKEVSRKTKKRYISNSDSDSDRDSDSDYSDEYTSKRTRVKRKKNKRQKKSVKIRHHKKKTKKRSKKHFSSSDSDNSESESESESSDSDSGSDDIMAMVNGSRSRDS